MYLSLLTLSLNFKSLASITENRFWTQGRAYYISLARQPQRANRNLLADKQLGAR